MPLLKFWESNPRAVEELTIEQVVSSAGDGSLKDGSHCSEELRSYLAQILTSKIAAYVEHCLTSGFSKGGMVLQDLINELGRRLDYDVKNGRYQGVSNEIGFDGLWLSPDGHTIVAEVKTTDAYRISLDTIVAYRGKLIDAGKANSRSSILIVVGREDTGELEAQVRGSRHAWDIRLISADSLIKLVQLKESSGDPETGRKIRSLLTPLEYTRLDQMIDVVFTTAKDVEGAAEIEHPDDDVAGELGLSESRKEASAPVEKTKGIWQFTDSQLLDQKRQEIVNCFGRAQGTAFVKKSRALFWDASHQKRIICTISKRYPKSYLYWYAYHPEWHEFLREGSASFLILGCMDLPFAFAVPWRLIDHSLDGLNTTTTAKEHTYWHIHLIEAASSQYAIVLPKKSITLALSEYRIELR